MQHLEVSGAVRHIYVIRRLKVKICIYTASGWPERYVMLSNPTACTPPVHGKSLARHQRLVLYYEGKNRLNEITDGISIFFCRNESCLSQTLPTHVQEPDTKLTPTLHKTPQKPDIHSANKPTFFIIFLFWRGVGVGARYPVFHFHGNPFPQSAPSKSQSPNRHLKAPTSQTPPYFQFTSSKTRTSNSRPATLYYAARSHICKGGDTLSSRHVSSCDVTRAVGM